MSIPTPLTELNLSHYYLEVMEFKSAYATTQLFARIFVIKQQLEHQCALEYKHLYLK